MTTNRRRTYRERFTNNGNQRTSKGYLCLFRVSLFGLHSVLSMNGSVHVTIFVQAPLHIIQQDGEESAVSDYGWSISFNCYEQYSIQLARMFVLKCCTSAALVSKP